MSLRDRRSLLVEAISFAAIEIASAQTASQETVPASEAWQSPSMEEMQQRRLLRLRLAMTGSSGRKSAGAVELLAMTASSDLKKTLDMR